MLVQGPHQQEMANTQVVGHQYKQVRLVAPGILPAHLEKDPKRAPGRSQGWDDSLGQVWRKEGQSETVWMTGWWTLVRKRYRLSIAPPVDTAQASTAL